MTFKMRACIALSGITFLSLVAAQAQDYQQKAPPYSDGTRPYGERVQTDGKYKFKPPKKGDQRGPCPALNALANHGYLPRSGVGTVYDFVWAMKAGLGVAPDLGSFLALYGVFVTGNGIKFSIGGPTNETGHGSGLIYSHNIYESDASIFRGDKYLYHGDNYHLQMFNFGPFYKNRTRDYPKDLIIDFRLARITHSLFYNPYFCCMPIACDLVAAGNYIFTYSLFANFTYPEGVVTRQVLRYFYSVYPLDSDGDDLEYKPGWERFPSNWYKRPSSDEYTFAAFLLDVIDNAKRHPGVVKFGCNAGKVNSFVGIDVGYLTGGLFNAATLLEGNNLICFWYQILQAVIPHGARSQLLDVYAELDKTFRLPAISGLGCPQLTKYDKSLFDQFPGYAEQYK